MDRHGGDIILNLDIQAIPIIDMIGDISTKQYINKTLIRTCYNRVDVFVK